MLKKPVTTIGIIGGGSAGYLSALYLKKLLPGVDVTLIESSKIPIIGVGEATTQLLLEVLHDKLGYSVREFFQQAKPTLKLGVKLEWGKPGSYYYNNPFGYIDIANAVYHTHNANNMSLVSMLMDAEKTPFIRQEGSINPLNIPRGYAYHIDNRHFIKYLKTKLADSGCKYEDAEISQVALTEDENAVAHVTDTMGKLYKFDLFIDATGFKSLLLSKTLKTKWVDFSASLKTNRAIIGMRPNDGEIQPYTTAATLKHGWLWNTPMQQEDHLGYVFSKEHVSDDEAFAELKAHCKTVNSEKIINFKPGRYENSWVGNVIAIGNSFAFVEPLESTGLHMILRQVVALTNSIKNGWPETNEIKTYNDNVNAIWDNLRYFIAMHFKYNQKLDTPFWLSCQHETEMSGMQEYIDYFMANGPLYNNKASPLYTRYNTDAIFSVSAYDINLTGCGVNEEYYKSAHEISDSWINQYKIHSFLTKNAVGQREALTYLEENETSFASFQL